MTSRMQLSAAFVLVLLCHCVAADVAHLKDSSADRHYLPPEPASEKQHDKVSYTDEQEYQHKQPTHITKPVDKDYKYKQGSEAHAYNDGKYAHAGVYENDKYKNKEAIHNTPEHKYGQAYRHVTAYQYQYPARARTKQTQSHQHNYNSDQHYKHEKSKQQNNNYGISTPIALEATEPPNRPRAIQTDYPSNMPSYKLFTPANTDPYYRHKNSDQLFYATAPNSVFHTQINLQSQDNQFNVPNNLARPSAGVRVVATTSSADASNEDNEERFDDNFTRRVPNGVSAARRGFNGAQFNTNGFTRSQSERTFSADQARSFNDGERLGFTRTNAELSREAQFVGTTSSNGSPGFDSFAAAVAADNLPRSNSNGGNGLLPTRSNGNANDVPRSSLAVAAGARGTAGASGANGSGTAGSAGANGAGFAGSRGANGASFAGSEGAPGATSARRTNSRSEVNSPAIVANVARSNGVGGSRSTARTGVQNVDNGNSAIRTDLTEQQAPTTAANQSIKRKSNFQALNLINGNVQANEVTRLATLSRNTPGNAQAVNIFNGNIIDSTTRPRVEENRPNNAADAFEYEPNASTAQVIYTPADDYSFAASSQSINKAKITPHTTATGDRYTTIDADSRSDGYHYAKPDTSYKF